MKFLTELRSCFETALRPYCDDPAPYLTMIRPTQDPKFGDFQANFAMPLAKQRGTNPRELAAEIAGRVEVGDLCQPPEVAGPGFINLRLRDDRLEAETRRLVSDERLGAPPVERPRTIIVDYSSPNVAKPMHVGHLRSTVIGAALYRILRFLGHRVIGDNHIGDWGTQFGMIIYGYKHFLDGENYQRDPVGELARLYRLVNQLCDYYAAVEDLPCVQARLNEKEAALESAEAEADPKAKDAKKRLSKLRTDVEEVRDEAASLRRKIDAISSDPQLNALATAHPRILVQTREETAKLHAGDEQNRALWDEFIPKCLEALQSMYDRLGVGFDLQLGESFYQPMLCEVVTDLERRGLARESDGAICVFLKDFAAPFIVRKADGAFTYATTDLATIQYRVKQLNAEAMLYVVDNRQSDHFRMLFDTARLWSYREVDFRHISFGMILGDDKRPYKTRSGDTVGLESLLGEAVSRARAIVDENMPAETSEDVRAEIAEIVGIGGIKYADLRHNRDSDYVFSWEKMLATTGDTATYIQYSFARISGIARKGGINREALRGSGARVRFTAPVERALSLQLNRFAEILDEVVVDYRPNILTQYLFDTANIFSTFYNECPVLQEQDESVRSSRLLLCDLTARVLQTGLGLLGIRTSEQM